MNPIHDDSLKVSISFRPLIQGQTLLERYRLESRIANGSMGVVWKAVDLESEKAVALRALANTFYPNEAALLNLRRGVQKFSSLEHPNIARPLDFVHGPRFVGIACEFREGSSIRALLEKAPHGIFSPADMADWISPICSALHYAHKAGATHGDLKPEEFLIDKDGEAQILDFGLASSVTVGLDGDAVMPVGATIGFASPRVTEGFEPSPVDDIYSFGATLYSLLTGVPPFFDESTQAPGKQTPDSKPPSINERRRSMDPRLPPAPDTWESTIAACLAYNVADRPQSAAELATSFAKASFESVEATSSTLSEPPALDSDNASETTSAPEPEPEAAPAPEAPTNLTATPGDGSIRLIWDAVDGATHYTIKQSDQSGGPYTAIGQTEGITDWRTDRWLDRRCI